MQALSSPSPAHMMQHAGGGGGAVAPPAPPRSAADTAPRPWPGRRRDPPLSSRTARGRDPLLSAALPVVSERVPMGATTAARAAVEAGLGAVVPDAGATARPPVAAVPTMRHVDPPAVRRTQGE